MARGFDIEKVAGGHVTVKLACPFMRDILALLISACHGLSKNWEPQIPTLGARIGSLVEFSALSYSLY